MLLVGLVQAGTTPNPTTNHVQVLGVKLWGEASQYQTLDTSKQILEATTSGAPAKCTTSSTTSSYQLQVGEEGPQTEMDPSFSVFHCQQKDSSTTTQREIREV